MSIRLASASSMRLDLASCPIADFPFTMLGWFNPASSASMIGPSLGSTADNTHYHGVGFLSGTPAIVARGTTETFVATATAATLSAWHFIMGRFISATSYRVSCLYPSGVIQHAQGTTSSTFGANTMTIGAVRRAAAAYHMNGDLAEIVFMDADPVGSDVATPDAFVRQLAYRGPFSIPRIRKDIVEYRSFRGHITENKSGEVYFRRRNGPQTWTNTNGVTLAPHVPHAVPWNPQYVRPDGDDRIVPVYVPSAPIAGGTAANMLLMGVGD